jgi:maleate cis-trans isomerase
VIAPHARAGRAKCGIDRYGPRANIWPQEVHRMAFSSWRGIVGMIHPTMRPGATEEVIRLLPKGIGLIPLFLNFRRGTTDEFAAAIPAYEQNVALLAEQACDLINPVGAPPFMVLGREAEARLVAEWEKKYNTTIFTVAQNHVAALQAVKAKTILGATYFSGKINNFLRQDQQRVRKIFRGCRVFGARHGGHRCAV